TRVRGSRLVVMVVGALEVRMSAVTERAPWSRTSRTSRSVAPAAPGAKTPSRSTTTAARATNGTLAGRWAGSRRSRPAPTRKSGHQRVRTPTSAAGTKPISMSSHSSPTVMSTAGRVRRSAPFGLTFAGLGGGLLAAEDQVDAGSDEGEGQEPTKDEAGASPDEELEERAEDGEQHQTDVGGLEAVSFLRRVAD